ncbi:MAG: biotin--[Synergistaceae bacterium]|nr:biotin--[acetyl-CoA-carboxylase] ligase [Synergistaceae bacterium]
MNVKEEALRMLEEKRRESLAGKGPVSISGESIAKNLGVSRVAVWKAIAALRKEGYRVNAASRRGYSLADSGDILTEEGVRAYLSPDSHIRCVVCLDTVDSTNTYAKKLAVAQEAGDGTLVIANRQTAGRGRRGHSFVSPPGTGLYMTLILRPTVELGRFQMITIAAAVAVCLALEELTPARPLVKWVNDVFLRGEDGSERKVCGILSEAVTGVESGEVESVVVGIGVNLTTREFGEGLEETAGSVFHEGNDSETQTLVTRVQLAARIAERLMGFAERLARPSPDGAAELIQLYRERSLLLGREISYLQGEEPRRGRAVDIDERGGLVVEKEGGGRTTLRSGEVHEVRPLGGKEKL